VEKRLRIGNFYLLPKSQWEELGDINSFYNKIGIPPSEYLKVKAYINDLNKLGIYRSILEKYSNGITSSIDVTIEGRYRGIPATIDDPEEIDNFLSGDEAIAIDSNGDEHYVRKENANVLDWSEDKYQYFYFEKLNNGKTTF